MRAMCAQAGLLSITTPFNKYTPFLGAKIFLDEADSYPQELLNSTRQLLGAVPSCLNMCSEVSK
jgi:hypothetical protein